VDCQSNGNGVSGFRFGRIVGIYCSHITAAANGANGIETFDHVSDLYIDRLEMSGNLGSQITVNSVGTQLTFVNGLIEGDLAVNGFVATAATRIILSNMTIQGGLTLVTLDTQINILSNVTLVSYAASAISLSTNSELTCITGVVVDQGPVGLELIAGAGVFTLGNSYFNVATELTGTPAVGSRATGNIGIADF
jgi:hypothetical protein